MKYQRCPKCGKKLVDEVGICLGCSGVRKSANIGAFLYLFGVFIAFSYWIFRTWIYRGPFFDLTAKTEVIFMIWIFPGIGLVIMIISHILLGASSSKYNNLQKDVVKKSNNEIME